MRRSREAGYRAAARLGYTRDRKERQVSIQAVERKLSAIFAADIAGYSRLMGQDEVGTLARLRDCREVMDRLIASHRGRIFRLHASTTRRRPKPFTKAVAHRCVFRHELGSRSVRQDWHVT